MSKLTIWASLSRNVLDNIAEKLKAYSDQPLIQKWLTTTFRKWMIENAPAKQVVELAPDAPQWARDSMERKELWAIKWEEIDETIKNVVDYLQYRVQRNEPFESMNAQDAIRLQAEYHEALEARADKNFNKYAAIEEDGMTEVFSFDRFKWVELTGKQSLDREGKLMGHCVGSYYDEVGGGELRIYSLRDLNNIPHVTVEYDIGNKQVVQIKGKANKEVIKAYQEATVQFLLNFPKMLYGIDVDELGVGREELRKRFEEAGKLYRTNQVVLFEKDNLKIVDLVEGVIPRVLGKYEVFSMLTRMIVEGAPLKVTDDISYSYEVNRKQVELLKKINPKTSLALAKSDPALFSGICLDGRLGLAVPVTMKMKGLLCSGAMSLIKLHKVYHLSKGYVAVMFEPDNTEHDTFKFLLSVYSSRTNGPSGGIRLSKECIGAVLTPPNEEGQDRDLLLSIADVSGSLDVTLHDERPAKDVASIIVTVCNQIRPDADIVVLGKGLGSYNNTVRKLIQSARNPMEAESKIKKLDVTNIPAHKTQVEKFVTPFIEARDFNKFMERATGLKSVTSIQGIKAFFKANKISTSGYLYSYFDSFFLLGTLKDKELVAEYLASSNSMCKQLVTFTIMQTNLTTGAFWYHSAAKEQLSISKALAGVDKIFPAMFPLTPEQIEKLPINPSTAKKLIKFYAAV